MNKKILAILALLIVLASISAVSAFDLGDIFGGAKNETVTIDGVDFNIPADFKEDSSNILDEVMEPLKKEGAQITSKGYTKGDDDAVGLFVVNLTNGLTNKQALEIMGGNKTTINNVTGYILKDEDVTMFNFEKNDHLVVISSSDEKFIGDFLIA